MKLRYYLTVYIYNILYITIVDTLFGSLQYVNNNYFIIICIIIIIHFIIVNN